MSSEGNGIETSVMPATISTTATTTPQVTTREDIATLGRKAQNSLAILYATTTVLTDHVAEEKTPEGEILSDGGRAAYISHQRCVNDLIAGIGKYINGS